MRISICPPDPKLLRLRLRSEPAGYHAVDRQSGQQPAAARHRQDLPERERLRRVREVRPHLQYAHPLPHLPLHRHAHHCLRSALRHHRDPQVRFYESLTVRRMGFQCFVPTKSRQPLWFLSNRLSADQVFL